MPDSALFLRALRSNSTEEELLQDLANVMREVSGAHTCDVLMRDAGDGLVMRASTASPEYINRLRLGKGVGLCGECLATDQPIFLASRAERHPKYARYTGLEGHDSEAAVILPLRDEGAPTLGVVMLGKGSRWTVGVKTRERLIHAAASFTSCLLAFRSAYQAGAQTSRLGALSQVSKTISTSPYLEEILQLLVNLTAQQFNYRVCTVRLLDENRGELVLRATQAPAKAYQRKRAIKLGESIAGRAIAENRPIIITDVQVDQDYIGHDLAVEQGLRSMICVPLTIQDKTVGVLSCYTSDVHTFLPDEIKALETLAQQAAVSIEHAKFQVRDTLMQEMHHRVKNNLQQVASLLRLQIRHSTYQTVEQALNDSLARILAIASVHDLLSREDLDHVAVRSIAETLVHHQQSALADPTKDVRFQVRGHDIRLNMTQATQVSLVLNELIQNAVDHGFEVKRHGDIHVNVELNDGECGLWVSNNGDPLPPDFDMMEASHLGLKIVDNLARALGGRFTMKTFQEWTTCEVKFMRAGEE